MPRMRSFQQLLAVKSVIVKLFRDRTLQDNANDRQSFILLDSH